MATETRIVRIGSRELGHFEQVGGEKLGKWHISTDPHSSQSMEALREAARELKTSDIPVAFPTETVYGLAADATRSKAVKGIYAAKGRPADNPLIVHVSDLDMLRRFLQPRDDKDDTNGCHGEGNTNTSSQTAPSCRSSSSSSSSQKPADPIPTIYQPLIDRFWPGPLTILLPNPTPSKLAPEVTAGLPTFGARMPDSPLALTLIRLANAPLAAPSANASTKPSPTTATHVLDDLHGRIRLILDGGPCTVGVESTVVDGLCDPPAVLRPGGVSLAELRSCPGWEGAVKAYKDAAEDGRKTAVAAPRAPGMKYKHYSPRARVVLYEAAYRAGADGVAVEDWQRVLCLPGGSSTASRMGTIRTRRWKRVGGLQGGGSSLVMPEVVADAGLATTDGGEALFEVREGELRDGDGKPLARILDIDLGDDTRGIAQGLFSALRELDRRQVDTIFVDGISDGDDMAAAVMNRLRKAASEIRV
ncbi:translation factor [Sodiomyces alkalinus F11]|uniref:Threonylcarbamoyl-AMP synthase n=1 Tax=Sodiomyces alkalinus (strain CBS 110278 / VKM F-3762 / F11) TaxID=1314773 RepID=A0A3N2PQW6_SODAK|nr:translation factor [Sodiomyces alkalinus F11]ROT36860.1 translation factor [Sodiomyces alkalinus F11]